MKHLIIALSLLVATPVIASPRHPTTSQWRDIEKFGDAAAYCANHRTGEEGGEVGETKAKCDIAARLRKKLEAQGFCPYAKSGIGRAGGVKADIPGERHCYKIRIPN